MQVHPQAAILIIGNEILSGRTQDTNTSYLAKELNKIGIIVAEVRVIPDLEDEIITHVNFLRSKYDYVFTTGGIGPTHDDITSEAIAKAFGVELELNQRAVEYLSERYTKEDLTPARLKMAHIPLTAKLIPNRISKAPGFIIGNVFVMAGIPNIMQAMFDEIKTDLVVGQPMQSRTITLAFGEGIIAEGLTKLQEKFCNLQIGSYPFVQNNNWHTEIVIRGVDPELLEQAEEELKHMANQL